MEKEIKALLATDTGTLNVNDLYLLRRLQDKIYLELISDNETVRVASRIELKGDSPAEIMDQVNFYMNRLVQNLKKEGIYVRR